MQKHDQPIGQLPHLARQMLMGAARTEPTQRDPTARTRAIEEANRRIKEMFPRYFTTKD